MFVPYCRKECADREMSKYRLTFSIIVSASKDKVRSRYLVVKLKTNNEIPRNLFIKAIRKGAQSLGEGVYEDVTPWLTYFENNFGVIKYSHTKKDKMLELVREMKLEDKEGNPVEITSLGVSGTINKARKKYIP